VGADMRVGITDDKSNRAGQNLCLIRATRALLAPIAAQRVQCGATNATVRISEHRNQIVHELRHEEMIEKLTAPKAHIGAVMPKTFSYCRKSVETRPQQSTMRTPGVMRDRQLVHKGSVLIAHVVLRFAPRKEPDPDLGNALGMPVTRLMLCSMPAAQSTIFGYRADAAAAEHLFAATRQAPTRQAPTRYWLSNLRGASRDHRRQSCAAFTQPTKYGHAPAAAPRFPSKPSAASQACCVAISSVHGRMSAAARASRA